MRRDDSPQEFELASSQDQSVLEHASDGPIEQFVLSLGVEPSHRRKLETVLILERDAEKVIDPVKVAPDDRV